MTAADLRLGLPGHVILWRHGRTTWNMQRRYQGQADPPLDEVGRAQADAAARQLATVAPVAIVSSDLSRAARTAEALAAVTGLPVRLDARFRERALGHWEGLTREEVRRRFPREYDAWVRDHSGYGEPRDAVARRAMAGLSELPDDPAGPVVVVTHGATAVSLTGSLLGLPEAFWRSLAPLANCHWNELARVDGRWRLHAHNVGAIPARIPPPPGAVGADVVAAEQATPEPVDAEALAVAPPPVGGAAPGTTTPTP